ncbi:MAG: ferrous iron transport protein A [Clostridia bacterium]|nr:ferrous iron transport protein A [Clostridia bacterium]MCQ2479826.1 ferrous iron transport protein A [Clostridia bacterium]
MKLDNLKPGESGVIKTVGGEGALRLRLLDMGIIPKTKVKVQKIAPLGDPIQILIRGYDLTLRKEDAAMIDVEKEVR